MLLSAFSLALAEATEEKAPPVIDIDGTVLVQFAIFVVMFLILRAFLFKPYLKMRQDRADNIEGAEVKARQAEHQATELEAQYKERMQKARAHADSERAALQSQGRAREAELLGQARERAQARINETRGQITAQVTAAQRELSLRAETLGHQIASKLLGREV